MAQHDAYIWGYLKTKLNGNEYGTAGIMGNLYAESALCVNNLQNSYNTSLGYTDEEYTAAVDSGMYSKDSFINDKAGYGLAQWTASSRKKTLYEKWVKGGYDSISNIDLQLNHLWDELNDSYYSSVLDACVNATSVREASDPFLHIFENPADQSETVEELRAEYGQGYYDLYSGTYGDYTGGTSSNRKPMSKLLLYAVGSDIV